MKEKNACKTSRDQGDMTKCNVVSDLNRAQKRDVSGKNGEICIKSVIFLIVAYQYQFLSFDECTLAVQDINIRGTLSEGNMGALSTIFAASLSV